MCYARELMNMILFFFNDTATTEIYTLSLHDALPICQDRQRLLGQVHGPAGGHAQDGAGHQRGNHQADRSEEHTSELQSPCNLVCRLLLEKKNLPSGVTFLSVATPGFERHQAQQDFAV